MKLKMFRFHDCPSRPTGAARFVLCSKASRVKHYRGLEEQVSQRQTALSTGRTFCPACRLPFWQQEEDTGMNLVSLHAFYTMPKLAINGR